MPFVTSRAVIACSDVGAQCPKRNKLITFLRRGAPRRRREERAYRGYVSDEQRRERGWMGAGRPVYFASDAEDVSIYRVIGARARGRRSARAHDRNVGGDDRYDERLGNAMSMWS